MSRKLHLPGPAMVVALAALFVALSGTAVAAGVPALAKRALVADNAKKLGGQTPSALVSQAVSQASAAPGPASTAAGLTVIKSVPGGSFAPGSSLKTFDVACDAGQQVVGGGLSSDGAIATFDSFPLNATTWEVVGGNLGSGAANVTAYALCLK